MNYLRTFLSERLESLVWWKNKKKAIFIFRRNRCKLIKPRHCLFNAKQIVLGRNIRFDCGSRLDCYTPEARIEIGESSFFAYEVTILCASKIKVGKNCMCASHVFISDENHGTQINELPYIKQPFNSKPVEIGNNVWLGEKVIVLPGVHIGDNAVIGAGSVVTHDIPKNCMAVGNPARIIKIWNDENRTWEPINKSSKQATNGN
jgi:acetyltransferase-like isoleucine patch superfamily enzyme